MNKFVFDDGSEREFKDFSKPRMLRDSNNERPSMLYVDTGRLFHDKKYMHWVKMELVPRLQPNFRYM